jgi:hypothetical protein
MRVKNVMTNPLTQAQTHAQPKRLGSPCLKINPALKQGRLLKRDPC